MKQDEETLRTVRQFIAEAREKWRSSKKAGGVKASYLAAHAIRGYRADQDRRGVVEVPVELAENAFVVECDLLDVVEGFAKYKSTPLLQAIQAAKEIT